MKGTAIWGDKVIIMPVVYPHGMVSVLSLGYFSSICFSSKPSNYFLNLSLGARHIQQYSKKKKEMRRKFITPHQDKARCKERRKKMRVTVQAKLVVSFWEMIPM